MADSRTVAAVKRDLKRIGDTDLTKSADAAAALVMAAELDKPGNSATSKSMCARALGEIMERLQAKAPAEEKRDHLDDLSARRAKRRRRAAS